eukprot:1144367-Pelagomonas_calceolata.AAC.2
MEAAIAAYTILEHSSRMWHFEHVQFNWFRATMRFYNSLTKCNSLILKKVLHAGISLGSRTDSCWTSHLLSALILTSMQRMRNSYGGLVSGLVWSSWDASLRQGILSGLLCWLLLAGVNAWCSYTESLLKAEGVPRGGTSAGL